MAESIVIRINYNTLRRLKVAFPNLRGESAKDYFQRLAKYLEK